MAWLLGLAEVLASQGAKNMWQTPRATFLRTSLTCDGRPLQLARRAVAHAGTRSRRFFSTSEDGALGLESTGTA